MVNDHLHTMLSSVMVFMRASHRSSLPRDLGAYCIVHKGPETLFVIVTTGRVWTEGY